VGFVGLFYRHQGVHTLIEAASRIQEEAPTTRFLLVGDGVMRPHWEALAKRLNVAQAVQFTGQIPYQQIPLYLQATDVLVAPFTGDRGEVSPFKVLDALACCCPVIASALPSMKRLAEGFGEAVTLVPPDDAEALATTTATLLKDPQLRLKLGMRGREGILRHYAWKAIAEDVETAITETQGKHGQMRQASRRSALRSKVASTIRGVTSWAPILHVVPRPDRPPGVSAIVRVKDEETWLSASIQSIATIADEIIIGDNGSTDRTPEIISDFERKLQDQLIVERRPDMDFKHLTNVLIDRTRFRWVIRWDADFVARTDGPQSIFHLRKWLFDLDPRRYVCAHLRMIELCGDLFHQRPKTASRADAHCFTYSDSLRYVYDRAGHDAPKIPRWYQVLRYEIPTFFHVDVKPVRRMFLSFLWKRYITDPERARYPRFETYLETKLKEQWEGQGIDEAAASWAASVFRDLVPYDRNRFGDYPTLLKPSFENSNYLLLYKDGQIVGQQTSDNTEVSVVEAGS
jgi:glycosyltransferase involved in cell wall biosynthesis